MQSDFQRILNGELDRESKTISLIENEQSIKDYTPREMNDIYKSNEEKESELKEYMKSKIISDGQYKYLRFLAYNRGEFNEIKWELVKKWDMQKAKEHIVLWKNEVLK